MAALTTLAALPCPCSSFRDERAASFFADMLVPVVAVALVVFRKVYEFRLVLSVLAYADVTRC